MRLPLQQIRAFTASRQARTKPVAKVPADQHPRSLQSLFITDLLRRFSLFDTFRSDFRNSRQI